jgi:hypothetical protein
VQRRSSYRSSDYPGLACFIFRFLRRPQSGLQEAVRDIANQSEHHRTRTIDEELFVLQKLHELELMNIICGTERSSSALTGRYHGAVQIPRALPWADLLRAVGAQDSKSVPYSNLM